jgi:5S rRNA maturation endonuclease (ribonuclease M5)
MTVNLWQRSVDEIQNMLELSEYNVAILEGKSDIEVLESFFKSETHPVETMGKPNAKEVVKKLTNDQKVDKNRFIAICDNDYDRFLGKNYSKNWPKNYFYLDCHSLDSFILTSNSLIVKILNHFSAQSLLEKFDSIENFKVRLFKAATPLGKLRLTNQIEGYNLDFKILDEKARDCYDCNKVSRTVPYNSLINASTLELKEPNKAISELLNLICSKKNSGKRFLKKIITSFDNLNLSEIKLCNIANGHDVVSILAFLIRYNSSSLAGKSCNKKVLENKLYRFYGDLGDHLKECSFIKELRDIGRLEDFFNFQ